MKILVIGKEGRLQKNADPAVYARHIFSYVPNNSPDEALLMAIRSGKLAGAGLDCVADEPVRKDNAILQAEPEVEDKILFSPHVGGITASSFKRGYRILWENIARIESGQRPTNSVNL